MRILGIIFYSTIITLIGFAFIVFAFHKLEPQQLIDVLVYIQTGFSSRMIVGLSGVLLIILSISFAQIILGRFQKEKTIAFPTSSGEVTIALAAVEDLIRRLSVLIPEVKELRPNVVAKKDTIIVDLRVALKSGSNMPELTSRLQELVKSEIERVLGLEQEPIVNIHITKIASLEDRDRKRKESDKQEPTIPFGGYGRV